MQKAYIKAEAVDTTVYILNKIVNIQLGDHTP